MDLPLMIPRFLVRKMVSDAYKAGQLDQAREDVRTLIGAQREVVSPQGLLLRQQDIAARPARIYRDRQKLITHINPDPLPPKLQDDDCGDLVRSR